MFRERPFRRRNTESDAEFSVHEDNLDDEHWARVDVTDVTTGALRRTIRVRRGSMFPDRPNFPVVSNEIDDNN